MRREIAEILVDNLVNPEELVRSCEIAGPGFINIRLSTDDWYLACRTAAVPASTHSGSLIAAPENGVLAPHTPGRRQRVRY